MARTIQSPGVEVKEVDLSLRPQLPVGTTVFIPGFANQGPTDELLSLTSLSEFEQVYGLPQNAAERYMYHTVKAVFQSPANVLVTRLPYGLGAGATVADKYSVQVFPVIPRPIMIDLGAEAAGDNFVTVANDTRQIAWYESEGDELALGSDFDGTETAAVGSERSLTVEAVTPGAAGNSLKLTLSVDSTASDSNTNVGDDYNIVCGGMTMATLSQFKDKINEYYGDLFTATGGNDHVAASFSGTFDLAAGGIGSEVIITLDDATAPDVTVTGDGTGTLSELLAAASVVATTTGDLDQVPATGKEIAIAGQVSADVIMEGAPVVIELVGGTTNITGFSTKVTPVSSWTFGETSPGEGWVATTLKDAVDSVIASIPSVSAYSQDNLYWTPEVEGDLQSVPALNAYEIEDVADLVAEAVNAVGWDLAGSNRYYLGEPSNIELSNDEFQKTIKGEIKMKETEAGKYSNQKFTTYQDLKDKGGAGVMIVNDKKFVINEKFEGYYVGISDNTNLNPASDFDSVGKLKSLSKSLGGTTGGYVNVPDQGAGTKSRLTFSLSAGFAFDQYGNKSQVGLDGSMSEVMENLSEFDLNTDEFSDVLTLAVFKVRQSTLEPDATKLDYLVADSVIGSTNYFRERFLSTGGTAVSYYIESEADNSNNLYLKMNEGISKTAGNWMDENGFPTRKVRVLGAKDVRYFDELSETEQTARQGETEAEKREVNNFKVAQGFLNGREEQEDRLYIKAWQDLQRSGAAQIKHGQNVYPHGVYRKQAAEAKETGNIPAKLDRVFELADNFDLFPIDITVEGGLGTVYVGSEGGTKGHFDDEEFFPIGEHSVSSTGLSGNGLYQTKIIDNRNELSFLGHYDTIFDTFKSFSQFARKDNIFIADPLRYIFVQGRNSKTLTSKQREAGVNFSQHIYWPLRHMMTGGTKNSSYCTTYANWGFTNDKALNRQVWVPTSGFAAAAMGNTDSNFHPWIAPAGFTRGLVSGLTDLAFYPKQKERDQLYKIGLNPIANFPNEGFAIFGQKTMQAKPSAFDRINVRRLFLYLQKAVMNTVKFFVFEPNTLFTRTQVINVLRPIFEEVKNTQGMYDYLLVCDERNNSPDVIDRNELVVDIYIKPTRAAEFILVNFYATRTGQDFSELLS